MIQEGIQKAIRKLTMDMERDKCQHDLGVKLSDMSIPKSVKATTQAIKTYKLQ